MGLLQWADQKTGKLRALDIALLKICVAAFALLLAKLWPPLLALDWKVYAAVFLLTYVPLAVKFFMGDDGHA